MEGETDFKKDIIQLQNERNQCNMKRYCKKIQYQSMYMDEWRYRRKVYVEAYELLVEKQLKITSLLEKLLVGIIARDCGYNIQMDETTGAQLMQVSQDTHKELKTFFQSVDQFSYKPSQNAMYISFKPTISLNGATSISYQQRLRDKYFQLQSLEQRVVEQKNSNSYKEDMDAFETKQVAEKFFDI